MVVSVRMTVTMLVTMKAALMTIMAAIPSVAVAAPADDSVADGSLGIVTTNIGVRVIFGHDTHDSGVYGFVGGAPVARGLNFFRRSGPDLGFVVPNRSYECIPEPESLRKFFRTS